MSSIMIVEDEALIALSLQTKLEKFGYTIPALVHTGEEAVEEAAKCNPDLILMDINLGGGINGITAAGQINAKQKTPIVFLTAYSDEATLQSAIEAEPYAYLIKPFKDRELRSTIEVTLIKHQKETDALNKAKAKAEESDRLKNSFLSTISHEIRTPMNGILGFTEMLKQPGFSIEAKEKFLTNIEVSGNRLVNLVNDILNISKADSNSLHVSVHETDINSLIETVFNSFKPEANKKGLELLIQTGLTQAANVKTDKAMLEAILNHLVGNAIKFTAQGSIELGYRLSPAGSNPVELEFFVKDTGIGISGDKQGIIFERFRQADESKSRSYEGAGLGLSVAKAFVELLGGRIRVESEPEKGSVFYFTVPFEPVKSF